MIAFKPVLLGLIFAASPSLALVLDLPCAQSEESGMESLGAESLDFPDATSGLTVEYYGNATTMDGFTQQTLPPPVPQLADFFGVRVTACASAEFLVLRDADLVDVSTALTATEFLHPTLQAGGIVAFSDLRRAVEALYGPVLILRETTETCGCSALYPSLRPAGVAPYTGE